jgi:hypothetical protein
MALPNRQPSYYPEIEKREHDDLPLPETKRVSLWGWDATNLRKVKLAVDPDGKLISSADVDLGELEELTGKVVFNRFGEASVAGATETSLCTITVPTGKKYRVHGVFGEGGTDGIFRLFVDGTKVWQGRNAWTSRSLVAKLEVEANADWVIELKVENQKNTTNPFSGGFYGYEL